jgi:hypothetical protein
LISRTKESPHVKSILERLMTDPPPQRRERSPLFDLMNWRPEAPPPMIDGIPLRSDPQRVAKLLAFGPTNSNAVLSPFRAVPFGGLAKINFPARFAVTAQFSAEVDEELRFEDDREF